MGVGRKAVRKRAVGTREHIVAYLTEIGELYDANGMASTRLAAAVGYPGSSVAFAQLLSGMERSGLIEREVRGKRTYRISSGPADAVRMGGAFRASAVSGLAVAPGAEGISRVSGDNRAPVASGGVARAAAVGGGAAVGDGAAVGAGTRDGVASGGSGAGGGTGAGGGSGAGGDTGAGSGIETAGFDYDELARRLLVQVVRRLAATEREPDPRSDSAALQETVSGLEYELATAWTKHGKLAEENVRLREQLRAAQRSLALAAERVRRLQASSELGRSEVVLLQRLLTSDDAAEPGRAAGSGSTASSAGSGSAANSGDSGRAVGSGQEGLEEAHSVVS